MRKFAGMLLVAGATASLTASPASAAFIYEHGSISFGDALVYAGTFGEGEVNDVVITQVTINGVPKYDFKERAPGTTITDWYSLCQPLTPTEVICDRSFPDGRPLFVDAELHDGNDTLDMRTTSPARIEGGLGDDVLNGGSSNDTIDGNGDFDPGNPPDGNDTIDGRGGADYMNGEVGFDTISYASRSTSVNVSLDDFANDGGPGEGDNARSENESIVGTNAPDTLTGSAGPNPLFGSGGGDTLNGMAGPDLLDGGDGGDSMDGGAGPDTLYARAGADTLMGGFDNDTMDGGTEDDRLFGGPGPDDMSGGPGIDDVDYAGVTDPLTVTPEDNQPNDGASGEGDNVHADINRIFGGEGPDTLSCAGSLGPCEIWARGGNDTLIGGDNNDRLEGMDGNDTLDGGPGGDLLNGGGEVDTVDYRTHAYDDPGTGQTIGSNVSLDGIQNDGNNQIDATFGGPAGGADNVGTDVENILGSPGPDVLVGSIAANQLVGNNGNDTLEGLDGNDNLAGGAGLDTLDGHEGNDVEDGGADPDLVDGQSGDDTLRGAAGPDGLNGEEGNDTLDGGTGADSIDGGPDVDTATYASRSAALRVSLNDVANDGETGEGDNVRQTVENVQGGSGADQLIGSGQANRLMGGPGDDVLDGAGGPDMLDGQTGVDRAAYGSRRNALNVSIDGVPNDGQSGEGDNVLQTVENVQGGMAADVITGSSQNNLLLGGAGGDRLDGGKGADVVDGQTGVDTLTYAQRTSPVAVTLDGTANDGADPNKDGISTAAEEGDQDLRVEIASGGKSGDILSVAGPHPVPYTLLGDNGNDTLDTRDGGTVADHADCGAGTDGYRIDPSDTQVGCETALP